MKRLLALLAILLISQVGYGQQKMDQLFNAFRGESDVTSVNIGNITMKLASLFTETMGVNGIDILEFDNCAQEVKDRLSTAIRNLRDPDYETMVTANERDSRTKVLVKIKEDMIRELVIFTTGSDNALIRIKGTPGAYKATLLTIDPSVTLRHAKAEEQNIRIVPTYSPIREKEVEAIFTINGRTYKYIIPEGTCWNKGYKYSYKLYFDGKDIRLHDSVAYIWTPKLKKK